MRSVALVFASAVFDVCVPVRVLRLSSVDSLLFEPANHSRRQECRRQPDHQNPKDESAEDADNPRPRAPALN